MAYRNFRNELSYAAPGVEDLKLPQVDRKLRDAQIAALEKKATPPLRLADMNNPLGLDAPQLLKEKAELLKNYGANAADPQNLYKSIDLAAKIDKANQTKALVDQYKANHKGKTGFNEPAFDALTAEYYNSPQGSDVSARDLGSLHKYYEQNMGKYYSPDPIVGEFAKTIKPSQATTSTNSSINHLTGQKISGSTTTSSVPNIESYVDPLLNSHPGARPAFESAVNSLDNDFFEQNKGQLRNGYIQVPSVDDNGNHINVFKPLKNENDDFIRQQYANNTIYKSKDGSQSFPSKENRIRDYALNKLKAALPDEVKTTKSVDISPPTVPVQKIGSGKNSVFVNKDLTLAPIDQDARVDDKVLPLGSNAMIISDEKNNSGVSLDLGLSHALDASNGERVNSNQRNTQRTTVHGVTYAAVDLTDGGKVHFYGDKKLNELIKDKAFSRDLGKISIIPVAYADVYYKDAGEVSGGKKLGTSINKRVYIPLVTKNKNGSLEYTEDALRLGMSLIPNESKKRDKQESIKVLDNINEQLQSEAHKKDFSGNESEYGRANVFMNHNTVKKQTPRPAKKSSLF
jgi:hypothetical protein